MAPGGGDIEFYNLYSPTYTQRFSIIPKLEKIGSVVSEKLKTSESLQNTPTEWKTGTGLK